MKPKLGLVLSGGGARGAFQVGVLRGVSEILLKHKINPNIRVYCGVSAGAINATHLASFADDFHLGVERLLGLWSSLTHDQVFASDAAHMGRLAVTWARDFGFGSLMGSAPGQALLDTAPLRKLLNENLVPEKIEDHIRNGKLDALALTAVDYSTSNSITFVQGVNQLPTWNKSRRKSEKTTIGISHVMASAAIPTLFPPIQVGDRWFGDGCVRNAHPCSPALFLGAEKLLVIGVRMRATSAQEHPVYNADHPPSVARVINMLLNAVLLDGVELDVERLERVNEFVNRIPVDLRSNLNFKVVEHVMISPSGDIGHLASMRSSRLPRLIRYLIKGLGTVEDASEIVSYLLFDPLFCKELIEMGREDAWKSERDIVKLFSEEV